MRRALPGPRHEKPRGFHKGAGFCRPGGRQARREHHVHEVLRRERAGREAGNDHLRAGERPSRVPAERHRVSIDPAHHPEGEGIWARGNHHLREPIQLLQAWVQKRQGLQHRQRGGQVPLQPPRARAEGRRIRRPCVEISRERRIRHRPGGRGRV